MTVAEIKTLALEYGAGCLGAEVAGFCNFFHLTDVFITYQMSEDKCDIFLNDKGEIEQIYTMYFKDVAMAVRFPGGIVNTILDKLKAKYNLQEPGMISVPLNSEGEEQ